MTVDTSENRLVSEDELGYLGPPITLIRTVRVSNGDTHYEYTEEVKVLAAIGISDPACGLPGDHHVTRARFIFGSILDQWGSSG